MSKHGKDTSSTVVGKGGVIAIAAAGLLVVLVLGLMLWLNRSPAQENPVSDDQEMSGSIQGGGTGTVIDETTDDVGESEKLTYGFFETSMYDTLWVFDKVTMTCDRAYVGNLETNVYDLYFTIEDENGNILYTSDIIPIGSSIDSVTLAQDLEPGRYECLMVYHLLEPGTTKEIDGLNLVLYIDIKESGG